MNTLIKASYASVRQSRDSLHRDRHNGPEEKSKKSGRRRALKPLEVRSSKSARICVLWHTTMSISLV